MTRHESLFNEYVAALRERMIAAQAWWSEVITAETRLVGNETLARERLDGRWPFGPASHPYVIAVFHEFFLKCESLNERIEADEGRQRDRRVAESDWGQEESAESEPEQAVPGMVLLVDMLWGRHDDLAQFLEGLPLKPIATDPVTGEFI